MGLRTVRGIAAEKQNKEAAGIGFLTIQQSTWALLMKSEGEISI